MKTTSFKQEKASIAADAVTIVNVATAVEAARRAHRLLKIAKAMHAPGWEVDGLRNLRSSLMICARRMDGRYHKARVADDRLAKRGAA